jgi:hypothetical protein
MRSGPEVERGSEGAERRGKSTTLLKQGARTKHTHTHTYTTTTTTTTTHTQAYRSLLLIDEKRAHTKTQTHTHTKTQTRPVVWLNKPWLLDQVLFDSLFPSNSPHYHVEKRQFCVIERA